MKGFLRGNNLIAHYGWYYIYIALALVFSGILWVLIIMLRMICGKLGDGKRNIDSLNIQGEF